MGLGHSDYGRLSRFDDDADKRFGEILELRRADAMDVSERGRSEERRVGKECRSRGSPDH